MNKEEKHKEWSKKIAEFERSGKRKEEWCKKKKISIKQFNYWYGQFSEENRETQWLPIEIKEEKILPVSPLNIKIGAASIEVYPGYDKEFLLDILITLKAL